MEGSTESFTPSDTAPIFLTPNAIDAAAKAMQVEGEPGDNGIRICIIGGGCSGYQYDLQFEKEPRPGDVVMEYPAVKVYIDAVSVGYLKGTTVDFLSGLNGQGFKFTNPNAKRTCGCGQSFG